MWQDLVEPRVPYDATCGELRAQSANERVRAARTARQTPTRCSAQINPVVPKQYAVDCGSVLDTACPQALRRPRSCHWLSLHRPPRCFGRKRV